MKRTLLAAAAALAFAPMLANAQSQKFAGFDVGLNVGFKSTSAKLSDPTTSIDSTGKTDFGWALTGGYTIPLAARATLGIGASFDLSSFEFAKVSDPSFTAKAKMKDHYSVGVEPGWVASDNTLLYGKLYYHSANISLDVNSSSAKQDFKGLGYGVGVKVLMTPNLYVRLDLERVDYDGRTLSGVSVKPTDTTAMVGLGWKF